MGGEESEMKKAAREYFEEVQVMRPDASRKESSEAYFVFRKFKREKETVV